MAQLLTLNSGDLSLCPAQNDLVTLSFLLKFKCVLSPKDYRSNTFLKNCANPGLFLVIFVLFTIQFKWQLYKLKKRKWCTWDSNPGPQDVGAYKTTALFFAQFFANKIFIFNWTRYKYFTVFTPVTQNWWPGQMLAIAPWFFSKPWRYCARPTDWILSVPRISYATFVSVC